MAPRMPATTSSEAIHSSHHSDRVLRSFAVELRQLRSVEAVARHRHFTRAAEELHVAQSALSHQIRRLEQELGTPLFERTSRRVTPDRGRPGDRRSSPPRPRGGRRRTRGGRRAPRRPARPHLDRRAPARRRPRRPRAARALQPSPPGRRGRPPRGHRRRHAPLPGRRRARRRLLPARRRDPRRARRPSDSADEEVVAAFAPDRAPPAPDVGVGRARRSTRSSRRAAARPSPRRSDELFAEAGQPLHLALESGDPFLLRSLAARGFAHGDPASVVQRPGRSRARGAQPAPRRPPARGARLAPRAQPPARGTHVHRLRPARDGRRAVGRARGGTAGPAARAWSQPPRTRRRPPCRARRPLAAGAGSG